MNTILCIFLVVIIVLLVLNVPISQKVVNLLFAIILLLYVVGVSGWLHI
jgi:hypothetical protein